MSAFGDTVSASTPLAANGERQVLLTQAGVPFSGSAGTTILPAAGAWTASQVMPCDKQRRICLELAYDANAATTAGAAEVLVLLSKQKIKVDSNGVPTTNNGTPLITDDVWFLPMVANPTITFAPLAAGTLQGSGFTRTQTFAKVTYAPLVIEVAPVTANSDKGRHVIDIDATGSFWWYLQAREIGDTTNRGILNIAWSLGV